MIELILALCFILIGLFALIFIIGKRYFAKAIISAVITAASIFLIPTFYKLQRESGNPDMGKEFEQLYLPISVFVICSLSGIAMFIIFIIKSRSSNKNC